MERMTDKGLLVGLIIEPEQKPTEKTLDVVEPIAKPKKPTTKSKPKN